VRVRERQARETWGSEMGEPTLDSLVGGDLTGAQVWAAAPCLIGYLDRHRDRLLHGRTVIDIGAGTGCAGLSAAAFGARHVVLSDADSAATLETESGWEDGSTLDLLIENVALNSSLAGLVSVSNLRWGNEEHLDALKARWPDGFGTLIASDVLYYPPVTYGTLASTIRELAATSAAVVLAYRPRHGGEDGFVELLTRRPATGGMRFECVHSEVAGEVGNPEVVAKVVELRACAPV